MKVVVFGATGKTGELVWRKAVDRGLNVTVFGRSVERRYEKETVNKIRGDVLDAEAVERAVEGQEAVLVCIGPINTKDRTTLYEGANNIVAAMKKQGVQRVVFISSAGVGESWAQIPWTSKLLFSTMLKTVLAEHAREEEIFAQSGLNWTAVRPAVLTGKPATGRVIASNSAMTKTISREDLAGFLVEQVTLDKYVNQAISVTGG